MKIKDLVLKNRSYRRFHQEESIDRENLEQLVDLARLSGSGANMQALKFIISVDPEKNKSIFPNLAWAGYLKDWDGPVEGEQPSAYIIILGDKNIRESFGCDHGIAAQSILLGAAEMGLGGCMIGSIKKNPLREVLSVSEQYEILLVLALGRPKEQVVIEEMDGNGDIKYWRDEHGIHHVPKRPLKEIILKL